MDIDLKKLANLTKNEELVSMFDENFPKFPYYATDLQKVWKKANKLSNEFEVFCSKLYDVFDDLFPDIAVRKPTNHFSLENLPFQLFNIIP